MLIRYKIELIVCILLFFALCVFLPPSMVFFTFAICCLVIQQNYSLYQLPHEFFAFYFQNFLPNTEERAFFITKQSLIDCLMIKNSTNIFISRISFITDKLLGISKQSNSNRIYNFSLLIVRDILHNVLSC